MATHTDIAEDDRRAPHAPLSGPSGNARARCGIRASVAGLSRYQVDSTGRPIGDSLIPELDRDQRGDRSTGLNKQPKPIEPGSFCRILTEMLGPSLRCYIRRGST